MTATRWPEVRVALDGADVRRGARPAPSRRRAASSRRRSTCPSAPACRSRAGSTTGCGACAARAARRCRAPIDYATTPPSSPTGRWLRTYRGHERGGRPCSTTRAAQDITADVVRRTARTRARAGFRVAATTDPGRVARRLGIDDSSPRAGASGTRARPRRSRRARRPQPRATRPRALTDPAGLGAHRVVLFAQAAARRRRSSSARPRSDARGCSMTDALEALLQEGRTFPPPEAFARRRSSPTPRSTTRPNATGRASGPSRRSRSTGSRSGTRSSSGSCRSRSGSSAASSTSRTTASTATSRRPRRPGRVPLGGRAGRHTRGHLRRTARRDGRVANLLQVARRAEGRPRRDLHGHGARDCRSRCSRARGSARRTRSCSAASPRSRCATASTTRRRRCSSPPTARGGAARSSRSRTSPTKRSRRRRRSSTSSCCAAPRTTSR